MHNDRKCILSVLICSPVRLLFKIIKNAYSFRASALLAENNEIADQMVQLHRLICYFVVLVQLLMGDIRHEFAVKNMNEMNVFVQLS